MIHKDNLTNPWEGISLSDYENHMRLDSVMQLQTMNRMMKRQFSSCDVKTAMILGVAGGNGLEHAAACGFKRLYGVDINREYLQQCRERYRELDGILECLYANLISPDTVLPHADLLIANLLIEYIGYDCFCRIVVQICPQFVSCIIQINTDDGFVSDSPYLHVFDGLESVHHQMSEDKLVATMQSVGYRLSGIMDEPLPNGKKLVQLDFIHDIIE